MASLCETSDWKGFGKEFKKDLLGSQIFFGIESGMELYLETSMQFSICKWDQGGIN